MALKVLNALEEQAQSEWEACLPQEVDLQTRLSCGPEADGSRHGPKGAVSGGGAMKETPPKNASIAEMKATGQCSAPGPKL